MRKCLKLLGILATAAALSAPGRARADGLRLGTSLAALRFGTSDGGAVSLYYLAESARVSRGRAGLAFNVPMMGISGGSVVMSDENIAVRSGEQTTRFGMGDMSVGLEYNLVQDRRRSLIVTLGGNVRFPTGSTALGLGTGEHLLGLSLSGVYGITRRLLAFAELRHSWVGIVQPLAARTRAAEAGLVYWITDGLGVTASATASDYGTKAPFAVETNLGVTFEALPGVMVNAGALGGVFGASPQGGLTFGFGFEI